MPWPEPEEMESEKRIIFRILSLQNTSRKSKKFTVKVRINRGGNRKEVRENKIFRHDSCVYAITFLKKSLEIKLRPKELAEVPIILVYGASEDEVRKTLSKLKLLDAQLQLQKCIGLWKNWIDKSRTLETLNADYTKAYKQSLVAMKLLTFEKNGAIIAAGTSSLPASIVGTHSWDYRFMWVRDAYYACRAFLASNHFYAVKIVIIAPLSSFTHNIKTFMILEEVFFKVWEWKNKHRGGAIFGQCYIKLTSRNSFFFLYIKKKNGRLH